MSIRSAFVVLACAGLYVAYEVNVENPGRIDFARLAAAIGADDPRMQAMIGQVLEKVGVESGLASGIAPEGPVARGMGDADVARGTDMIALRMRQRSEMNRAAETRRQLDALAKGGTASFEGDSPFTATGAPSPATAAGGHHASTRPGPGARFLRPDATSTDARRPRHGRVTPGAELSVDPGRGTRPTSGLTTRQPVASARFVRAPSAN